MPNFHKREVVRCFLLDSWRRCVVTQAPRCGGKLYYVTPVRDDRLHGPDDDKAYAMFEDELYKYGKPLKTALQRAKPQNLYRL